ncbi:MAG: hypothetical protein NTX51_01675, partial [Verrucomicrobia bacterium]|nr:hypothetical protein [Verrucomicrobiota bacterium]
MPIANRQSPIANRQSPITNRQSPIANRQSPIANRQSPIANHQSPITNRQSPIANRQSPIVSCQLPMLLGLLWEKLPFFALSAASCVVTVLAQKADGALAPLQTLPFGVRILNALDGYFCYVWKLLWPTDLAVIYPFASHSTTKLAVVALLLLTVTLLAWWQRTRRPYLAVGWAWYVGTLVPVIGLVQVGNQSMADRYTYLPAIGLFIIAAWGATDLIAAWPKRRSGRDASPRRPLPPRDGHFGEMSPPRRFG